MVEDGDRVLNAGGAQIAVEFTPEAQGRILAYPNTRSVQRTVKRPAQVKNHWVFNSKDYYSE